MLQPIVEMTVYCTLKVLLSDEITSKTVIYALVGAVVTLCGVIATMAVHIVNSHKKVDDMYEARIDDLKRTHELIDTLMGVVGLVKKGG